MKFDDVHRRHGQTGAVDHAPDVAVESDVVLGRDTKVKEFSFLLPFLFG